MKLNEVLDLDKQPQRAEEKHADYIQRLKHGRKRVLGKGTYGTVFQHPTMKNVAVKVARRGSGALDYVRYAINHQHNPYVPKIYDVRRFRPKGGEAFAGLDDYHIVFMEKLKPYDRLDENKKREILFYHLGLPPLKEYLHSHESVRDLFLHYDTQSLVHYLEETNRSPYLIDLLHFFDKSTARDLHDANIMLRGRDQIVFVDPAV